MDIKKLFTFQLAAGVLLCALFIFWLSPMPVIWNSSTGYIIATLLLLIYIQILYRKQNKENESNALILKRAGVITAVLFGIPLLIVGMNVKNQWPEYTRHAVHYFCYYLLFFYLIIHALVGLALRKYYLHKKFREGV